MQRTAPVLRLLAVIACTTTLATAQRGGSNVDWPWGKAAGGAAGSFSRADYFNLGLLGAKAWDADKKEPSREMRSGRRQVSVAKDENSEKGPRRLLVRALLGGGPAQRAGLKIDDVITGIGQETFEDGCFEPLARALQAAEAKGGKLDLQVERGGKTVTVTAKIRKFADDATTGKGRDKVVKKALDWLADRQVGGGFPETLGGNTGAVVQTCVAGLAWISGGSSLRGGKHKRNLDSAKSFVLRGLKNPGTRLGGAGGANWDQTTWAHAYAALFLGELALASKSKGMRRELQPLVDELQVRQEVSGGYGHGPGGKNALGYIELNILAGYVLCGLSVCQQAGCKVDEDAIEKLRGYTRASAGKNGGVGYADGPGQKGMGNIGRTALCWLGSLGLGLRDDEWTKTMESYCQEHIAEVLGGHASLQQHITMAGLAAVALGEDAMQKYWDGGLRRDMTLARAPDGSFQPRPWHESLAMQSNSDVSVGEVWTTASWAMVLGAAGRKGKKGGLPGLCGQLEQ